MEDGLADTSRQQVDDSRRHLDSKDTGRFAAFCRGPLVQHNFLVRCGECMRMLNPDSDQSERFWRIFPTGGYYTRAGDACAFVTWLFLVLLPFVAIAVGCVCPTNINIVITVVVILVMTSQLVLIYLIVKNEKKFYRLWYVSKVNVQQYHGWKNQVKDVNLETLNDLENVLSRSKHKGILTRLASMNHGKVSVLLCTKSYRSYHIIDPIVSLALLSLLEMVALIVQLEMMRRLELE